jgi:hypothetical protein
MREASHLESPWEPKRYNLDLPRIRQLECFV